MVPGGSKLKEVVEIAGNSRGFGAALYLRFSTEIYPIIFRVKVVVLSKVVCFKEFLSLKMTGLFSERQAQSGRHSSL